MRRSPSTRSLAPSLGGLARWSIVTALAATAVSAGAVEWPSSYPKGDVRGKALYDAMCIGCHGPRAAGDGPAAADLVVEVPDFSEGFGKRNRGALGRSVLRGKGTMPGFELSFNDIQHFESIQESVDAVLDYMERLGSKPPPEPGTEDEDPAKARQAAEVADDEEDVGDGMEAGE